MKKTQSAVKNIPPQKENPYLNYILLALFLILLIFFNITKISGEDDFYWHLASGRYTTENKTIPSTDVFSYTTQGQQWIPFEWAWDVTTYMIFSFSCFAGMYIFKTLLAILAFYIFLKILDKFKINFSLKLFFMLILAWGAVLRFSIRPHLITYLCFTLLIWIITSYKYFDRKNYKILYYLPLIFLVWTNFHLGVIAGFLMLTVFMVSETIIYFFPQKFSTKDNPALPKNELLRLVAVYFITACAMLVNPNHINTFLYGFTQTQSSNIQEIGEWKSPFYSGYSGSPAMITYKILLFAGLIVIYYSYKKKDLYAFLLFVVFAAYSLRAARFTPDYNIIVSLYIFLGIVYLFDKMKNTGFKNFIYYHPSFKIFLGALIIFQIITIQNDSLFNDYIKYYRKWGIGPDRFFIPEAMMDFVKKTSLNETGQRPFNYYGCGGLFIWTFPGSKDFIDSRYVNDDIYREYDVIQNMKPGFEELIRKYNIDYFLLGVPNMVNMPKVLGTIISAYLTKNNNDWKLIFWNDASLIFVKNEPKFADVISKYEYKYLTPFNYVFNKKMLDKAYKENREAVLNEVKRKLADEPDGDIIKVLSQEYR